VRLGKPGEEAKVYAFGLRSGVCGEDTLGSVVTIRLGL
jgi:hypothetical protein